jgi:hypothetical protein
VVRTISDWLRHLSTGWLALLALLVFVLFSVLVLPQQAAKAEQETGGSDSPDTSFFYTPSDLHQMAESYGEEGRQAYVRARFTFDLIWPLVYAFFLTTAIGWTFGRAFSSNSRWQMANLAPLLGTIFDYLENLSTSLVMIRYPNQTAAIDVLAPVFTALKWGWLGASFLLLLSGLIVMVWRRARKDTTGTESG